MREIGRNGKSSEEVSPCTSLRTDPMDTRLGCTGVAVSVLPPPPILPFPAAGAPADRRDEGRKMRRWRKTRTRTRRRDGRHSLTGGGGSCSGKRSRKVQGTSAVRRRRRVVIFRFTRTRRLALLCLPTYLPTFSSFFSASVRFLFYIVAIPLVQHTSAAQPGATGL